MRNQEVPVANLVEGVVSHLESWQPTRNCIREVGHSDLKRNLSMAKLLETMPIILLGQLTDSKQYGLDHIRRIHCTQGRITTFQGNTLFLLLSGQPSLKSTKNWWAVSKEAVCFANRFSSGVGGAISACMADCLFGAR